MQAASAPNELVCAGGSGNGPNYVIGPVTVVGPDEFALDTNDPDNIGCE